MFKEIRKRFLLGFPLGIFIGYTITILESILVGTGEFYAVSAFIMQHFSTPLKAVIVQYVCTGIIGAMFASTSIIFEVDEWSLLKQTIIHFLFTSIVMYICGYVCCWFKHDLLNTVIWFGVFIIFYVLFWIGFTLYYKLKIKKINKELEKK